MVFLTGGTGFLGAYIIQELVNKGYSVRAIRRGNKIPFFISPHIVEKVEWVDGDVLDIVALIENMKGASAVIHSAGMVSFRPGDRDQLLKINVEGTANVVNASLENEVPRFVHVSSVAALGRTKASTMVNETKKWSDSDLNTNYGLSKYRAEMEVWRGIAEGLNAVIINPSTILGYGDWHSSSTAIFRNAWNEFDWYSNGINGFVDVEDVARAVVLLMESDIHGERFIVSGDNWTFRKLFNHIADQFGKKHPSKEATPLLSGLAWRLEKIKSLFTGKPPLLTRETARIGFSRTTFDNSKLLNALPGFRFTSLEESLKKACEKYANTPRPA
jgi:dihydroflavonol-4-reductase